MPMKYLCYFFSSSPRTRSIFGSSPRTLHMRTRGLGYTAGVKGPEELAPFGASRRQALMDDY